MKNIIKVLAIVLLSVLSACSNGGKSTKKEPPKTENAMKEFAKNMKVDGATIKMVYWPKNAKDSVRVSLEANKDKKLISGISNAIESLETKKVNEKPVLPQTSVVDSFEIVVNGVTYNVSFYKEGYATYKNFKTGENQILEVSKDDIESVDKLAKTYQAK